MHIKKIIIKNFRNIDNCNFEPDKKLNFILGKNAQGKTNILESIYYSNFYKSFRTKDNRNLIKNDSSFFSLNFDIENKYTKNNLKLSFDKKNNKKILLNNKSPDSVCLYSVINTIIYYPSEINSLLIYPSSRRNLIDRSIFFIEPNYINVVKKYNKILRQRNSYLKSSGGDYDPWVDQLIDLSEVIISKRVNYINNINVKLNKLYFEKELGEEYFINYRKYNISDIRNFLYETYSSVKDKEKKYKYTLFGPHVEDFYFFINGQDIRKYSSEGQKKFFLLYFKYAQLLNYHDVYDDYPVILYDDYSSELDKDRQKIYFNKIFENSGQIFITATKSVDNIPFSHKLARIEDGVISDF